MTSLRDIARALGGEVGGGDSVSCPGPGHDKRDRSLSVKLSATSPDGFICHSFARDDWKICRDYVKSRLGLTGPAQRNWPLASAKSPGPRGRGKLEQGRSAGFLSSASAIWSGALPIAGTEGEAYLVGRGIALDEVPDHGGLRWHAKCPWGAGTAPCVVARFTDAVTAEPRGIWRRPLTGEKPKSLGPTKGCVIRLWSDDFVELGLVFGEGVETTLAAATRITHHGTYLRPAWAAGSASNMAIFHALSGIEALTLLVDHDPLGGGERAAEECACRWRDAGKEVNRLMPGDLGDFNDLVKP